MKQFNKTVLAVALFAAAGSASAAITAGGTSADQAYLVVYDSGFANSDSTLGLTYNRNLGVTFAQLQAGGITSLSTSFTGDTNWSTFLAGATSAASWAIVDGNKSAHSIFVTGGTTPSAPSLADPTVTFDAAATAISKHAGEINFGTSLAVGASDLVKSLPDNFTGQANHGTNPFANLWTGINNYNITTAIGGTANFYAGQYHLDYTTDYSGFGADPAGTPIVTSADIAKVGQITLTAAGITAVPLPAAVWLFGAGLMGMLRLNRRKSI